MNRVSRQSSYPSRTTLLLFPAILAVAYPIALRTSHSFAPAAILLTGGALVTGFVHAMQGLWNKSREAGQPAIGIVIGLVFRIVIGLFIISCMVYAAMWATGLL
jgi:hypothetical protein